MVFLFLNGFYPSAVIFQNNIEGKKYRLVKSQRTCISVWKIIMNLVLSSETYQCKQIQGLRECPHLRDS